MTGLDLGADALIEVAALVTDFDLNVLGEGIDLIIKPPAEALDQMGDFVRDDAREVRAARRARRRRHPGRGRGAGARLHQGALPRRQPAAAGRQHRRHRPRVPGPRHADPRGASCTTGSSTSPRSRSCRGAGSRAPTSRRRPSAATTARSPTSRRASRSCATTARPSSCPPPAPTATPPGPSRSARRRAHRPARRPRSRAAEVDSTNRRLSSPTLSPRSLRDRRGGYSSAGRAPPCGGGCRGFKSRYSPQRSSP